MFVAHHLTNVFASALDWLKFKCIGECSIQDHTSVYVHMDQVYVYSISNLQNCQVG